MLWGRPAERAGAAHRARVLLLPSLPLPAQRKLSPGVAHSRAWLGAAALLAALLLLAPTLATGLEAGAGGARDAFAAAARAMAAGAPHIEEES
jgi:hypothetical protein